MIVAYISNQTCNQLSDAIGGKRFTEACLAAKMIDIFIDRVYFRSTIFLIVFIIEKSKQIY